MRTALVGCGKVGRIHARVLSKLPESEFVGACDADANRAQAFAVEFNTVPFSSVTNMVRETGAQAVCVCTPHPLHAAAVVQAAEAGAHVLVEKPLAANLRDCDLMMAAAARHHVELGVVSQRRYFEPVQRMKTAVDAGKIGAPVLGTVNMLSWRDHSYYQSDPWRGKWSSEGGGVLVNQSPHLLDMLLWFMGPVEEISGYWANLNHPTVEVDDTAVASFRFRSGALGSLVASVSQRPGIYSKLHVHGSNGASVGVQTDTGATFIAGISETEEPPVNDLWTIPGEEGLLPEFIRDDEQQFRARRDPDYYHRLQIRSFLQAVSVGAAPPVTGAEGWAVVELFTAIYLSERERRPVRLPLESSVTG